MGSDNTIFASVSGRVNFEWKAKDRKYVNIVPVAAAKN
jgi:ribosomal protein L27